jgi:glycosyltransferase involved in cell wall biosynthesis
MKILLVNDTYYPNIDGSSIFTHRLAVQLKKRGNEVIVLAPARRWRSHYDEYENIPSFRVWSIPLVFIDFRFTPPFFIKKQIRKMIDDFKPDVIHIQGHLILGKATLDIAKERNIPIMGTNHFNPGNLSHFIPAPNWVRKKAEALAWKHFNSVFKKLNLVASPTETAANLLREVNFPKEVCAVSNGLDLERFNPNNRSVNINQKYNLPDKLKLIFVGRLDKDKRIEVLLRAMTKILEKCDVQLVIVGKGVELGNLKKMAKELKIEGNVTFAGFVPDEDLPSMYNACDCFVLACTVELQGLAAMEAMASGLPIVVVKALALPELVHEGENGYLFEIDDSEALAGYVVKIMQDGELRKKMGQKSLEIISAHDIDKSVGQYESMYKQIIESKNL